MIFCVPTQWNNVMSLFLPSKSVFFCPSQNGKFYDTSSPKWHSHLIERHHLYWVMLSSGPYLVHYVSVWDSALLSSSHTHRKQMFKAVTSRPSSGCLPPHVAIFVSWTKRGEIGQTIRSRVAPSDMIQSARVHGCDCTVWSEPEWAKRNTSRAPCWDWKPLAS